jgi:hypothetical protein
MRLTVSERKVGWKCFLEAFDLWQFRILNRARTGRAVTGLQERLRWNRTCHVNTEREKHIIGAIKTFDAKESHYGISNSRRLYLRTSP